jgi:hypothetical protein
MPVRSGLAARPRFSVCVAAVLFAMIPLRVAAQGDCENGNFDSTFELIQAAIFERHGCTSALCHGATPGAGGLDLRPEVAYDNLVDVPAQSTPLGNWTRVLAGQSSASLLWINLAAKTLPAQHQAPLRPMPLDPEPALPEDELEAVRLWIKAGAPRTGVVAGTADLLDACLPPPEPIAIKPLPPPAPGTGVQIVMPRWDLEAQTEHEVCFGSFYDVTDQVPPALRTAEGTFRFKFHQTRQDALSHHLIPLLYKGATGPESPLWGGFTCRGGAQVGAACDPVAAGACGPGGICTSLLKESIACINYGPGDSGIGLSTAGISITQQTAEEFRFAPGVYGELPLKGMILWNSHAFNLTDTPGKVEAWLNFDFALPEEQQTPAIKIFNITAIFNMNVPPFATDEPCNIATYPRRTNIFELSSHMHQRGKRWRTFLGAFRCQGGAADGAPCSPLGYDFVSPDVCGGAPCVSMLHSPAGDCDSNQRVTVDEIVTGVNIALERMPVEACNDADVNADDRVAVNEVVTAVGAALNGVPPPVARDPEESLLYVSQLYNDPFVMRLGDTPLFFNSPRDDERALTYCALYDNGYSDPAKVKKQSTSPPTPNDIPAGGPCAVPSHCTAGKVEEPCSGQSAEERNRSCDSSDGAEDGSCDACPLLGGVTTEDEMFILLGQYYVR